MYVKIKHVNGIWRVLMVSRLGFDFWDFAWVCLDFDSNLEFFRCTLIWLHLIWSKQKFLPIFYASMHSIKSIRRNKNKFIWANYNFKQRNFERPPLNLHHYKPYIKENLIFEGYLWKGCFGWPLRYTSRRVVLVGPAMALFMGGPPKLASHGTIHGRTAQAGLPWHYSWKGRPFWPLMALFMVGPP